jgi:hypothetical protein
MNDLEATKYIVNRLSEGLSDSNRESIPEQML